MPQKQRVLIDILREKTENGRKCTIKKQVVAQTKKEMEDKKLRRQMRQRAKTLFTECVQEAHKATADGKSEIRIAIMVHEKKSYPSWCQYLAHYTRELLEKEGLAVKIENETMEPHGSDPMFYETRYSTYLHISWK
ncbi:MAG: hypothetical protein Q7R73_03205 [bacterium]|nr:hypothetical protein [bacterium]